MVLKPVSNMNVQQRSSVRVGDVGREEKSVAHGDAVVYARKVLGLEGLYIHRNISPNFGP